jgi:hypothetical protein
VEIRPGVFRPDWSAVTKTAARQALNGRMTARAGLLDRWSHRLEAVEDLVWRTILRLYAHHGHAPQLGDVAAETGIAADRVATLFRKLQSLDLIGLDQASGQIRLAYPFTESATGHRVVLNGHTFHALCAIDALGVANMYGADITISSPYRHCGETIHVGTMAAGQALHSVSPVSAVIWYDFAYDGSAVASCCPAIVFFCSNEQLQQWLNTQTPRRDGVRLTVDEALEVGRAIFGPVLVERL